MSKFTVLGLILTLIHVSIGTQKHKKYKLELEPVRVSQTFWKYKKWILRKKSPLEQSQEALGVPIRVATLDWT